MTTRRSFAFGLAAFAAGCSRGEDLSRLAVGEQGRAVAVRSGEVLTLDSGLEVRLAGIETTNGAEPLAEAARTFLAQAVQGKVVTLLYGGLRRDRYDRALAHVRTDQGRRWMQSEMLEQGLARVRTYADNRAMAAEMLAAEARARVAKQGLWGQPDYQVLLPYECPGKSGFQIVEGRVSQVAALGSATALDFVGGGARVEIARAALPDFTAAGRDPQTLAGRLVRARGVLRGGIVRLDHPETLELLRQA